MTERKAAIIHVSKGLLNVSLATIAAIGSATGNVWVAGATSRRVLHGEVDVSTRDTRAKRSSTVSQQ